MRTLRYFIALVASICLVAAMPAHASANLPTNKGLYLSPTRDYATVKPGGTANQKIVLANNTNDPLTITLSVQQFSVADFSYDFRFEPVHDDWVHLAITQLQLDPGKSQTIPYTVTPPDSASPGGHYFSVFATATDPATKNIAQAATTLYVTVQGNITISSVIQSASIPRFAFGDIDFTMQIKNTGNTHFFVYVQGGFNGLSGTKTANATHLLLPQTVRQVSGVIGAPLWPGIYAATYGYATDSGQTVQQTSHIIYVPLWSLAVFGGLVWIGVVLVRRRWF